MKASVENPRGNVEKLSPKESVQGANTLLRGSARAPEGFSEGKPEAAIPRAQPPEVLQPMVFSSFVLKCRENIILHD